MYPQAISSINPFSTITKKYTFSTGSNDSDERLRKFQYLVNRYEINREFATRLRALEGYEIVFIVDGKFILNKSISKFNLHKRKKITCNTIKSFFFFSG